MARVWPFGLVLGSVFSTLFDFFFSVVEKRGVRTPWTPPLDPPLVMTSCPKIKMVTIKSNITVIEQHGACCGDKLAVAV